MLAEPHVNSCAIAQDSSRPTSNATTYVDICSICQSDTPMSECPRWTITAVCLHRGLSIAVLLCRNLVTPRFRFRSKCRATRRFSRHCAARAFNSGHSAAIACAGCGSEGLSTGRRLVDLRAKFETMILLSCSVMGQAQVSAIKCSIRFR